jgi:hypothetical protein
MQVRLGLAVNLACSGIQELVLPHPHLQCLVPGTPMEVQQAT